MKKPGTDVRFRYEEQLPRAIAVNGKSTNGAIHKKRDIFIYSQGKSNALVTSESQIGCCEAQLEEIISHVDNSNELQLSLGHIFKDN